MNKFGFWMRSSSLRGVIYQTHIICFLFLLHGTLGGTVFQINLTNVLRYTPHTLSNY